MEDNIFDKVNEVDLEKTMNDSYFVFTLLSFIIIEYSSKVNSPYLMIHVDI